MTDSQSLARLAEAGPLAVDNPVDPWRDMPLLKPHGGLQRPVSTEFLGTISAGYRNADGVPVVSRDGTIYITDSADTAPGLAEALAARGGKALTIAFGSDRPGEVIHQSLKRYSRSRLEAHGDAHQITTIEILPGQERVAAGQVRKTRRVTVWKDREPDKYAELAATCKAETFAFFYLARWTVDGKPEIYMPDGWACYRLRFTSLNSAEAIRNTLSFIATRTGGKIAGIPLELFIEYREMAGPDGVKRRVPVWKLNLQPPENPALQTPEGIRGILTAGIAQAAQLSLPAPVRIQTLEEAAAEAADVDLEAGADWTDGEIRELSEDDLHKFRAGGGLADFERFKRTYYALAADSSLRDDEGRADFVRHWTKGRTDSLREYATFCTVRDADNFLAAVNERATLERAERDARGEPTPERPTAPARPGARTYSELYPDDDDALSAPTTAVRPRGGSEHRGRPESRVAASVAVTGGPSVAVAAEDDDEDGADLADLAAERAAEQLEAARIADELLGADDDEDGRE